MAKGKKTGGKNFGVDGHQAYKPKLPKEIKEARKFDKLYVEEMLRRYLAMNKAEMYATYLRRSHEQ